MQKRHKCRKNVQTLADKIHGSHNILDHQFIFHIVNIKTTPQRLSPVQVAPIKSTFQIKLAY